MKQKWISLMALMLCAALLMSSTSLAGRDVTPEQFLEMTEDAQEQYLHNTGMSYEEAAGLSTDGGAALLDSGYVQCDACGGWYMSGNEFRNHICTQDASNPSSSWTGMDDYYDMLVAGKLDADTTVAIGNLYVNTANGKGLNMRTRPNSNSDIQVIIPNGAAVTLFWYENSSWAFVAYRSYFGFCMTRHLTDKVPGTSQNETKADDTSKMYNGFKHVDYDAVVKPTNPTGYVNMRWAPSKSTDVQGIYYANTVLHVIATNGTWSQVYHEQTNQCGFMMNAYLNKLLK